MKIIYDCNTKAWINFLIEENKEELNLNIEEMWKNVEDPNSKDDILIGWCGFLYYKEMEDNTIWIKGMAVSMECMGIGTEFINILKEKNVSILTATYSAQKFYKKNGFMDMGEVDDGKGRKITVMGIIR